MSDNLAVVLVIVACIVGAVASEMIEAWRNKRK
jgi:hypothetical protein